MGDDVLYKAGISNIKYIWHASDGSCDTCQSLDGTEYDFAEDIPDKPHPNCNCYIEEVCENDDDEEMCDCYELFDQLEGMVGDAGSLQEEIKAMLGNLFSQLKTKAGELYEDVAQAILDEAATWDNALGDFARNYNDMVDADTINGDKYFHYKANCQAAQRGVTGEAVAEAMSLLRELEEGTRKVVFEGADLIEQIEDAQRDMEANRQGREEGKENPDGDCDGWPRPNGLPDRF